MEMIPGKRSSYLLLTVLLFSAFLVNRSPVKGEKLIIKNYQQHLNPLFKKERRLSSRFIIIHTSEAGLISNENCSNTCPSLLFSGIILIRNRGDG